MDVDVPPCKRGKKAEEKREEEKKYIVIAARRVVSYTVRSSMTAGNAGLDVAVCVCVCVCVCLKGGGLPFR